ncbi:hypothetical protein [Spiroplasma endosymbiont of Labia minor]|uniref:hypothetical protein n=1 Tax=Spiroplasma endosymbiont of Labia minor TaxID=3066305 RepID=UPI0030D4C661
MNRVIWLRTLTIVLAVLFDIAILCGGIIPFVVVINAVNGAGLVPYLLIPVLISTVIVGIVFFIIIIVLNIFIISVIWKRI